MLTSCTVLNFLFLYTGQQFQRLPPGVPPQQFQGQGGHPQQQFQGHPQQFQPQPGKAL